MSRHKTRASQALSAEIDLLKKRVKHNRRQLDKTRKSLRSKESKSKDLLGKLSKLDSSYDTLTGLPDRTLFIQHLNFSLQNNRKTTAIILINPDRFNAINYRLGFQIGDQCLISISERIKLCIRSTDMLFRINGDEFAIIIDTVSDSDESIRITDRIIHSCRKALIISNQALHARVSAGIVINTGSNTHAEDLLRNACMALFKAKETGGDKYLVYNEKEHSVPFHHLLMEEDLDSAYQNNHLELYYQPIINMGNTMFECFEALLRWIHPVKGVILPGDFIPVAEKTGFITVLGRWVIEESCRQLSLWNTNKLSDHPIIVNINISVKQLYQDDFESHIESLIQKYRINPEQLRLEITESVLMQQTDTILEKLRRLKAMGFSLVLDDFGAGYSSISYLANLPVDTLKIDKSLIKRVGQRESIDKIIGTIIDLAHGMDISVVAEGVEKKLQFDTLKRLACDKVQGFMFSNPLPEKEATLMIRRLNIKTEVV